jgi:hypothetical protein
MIETFPYASASMFKQLAEVDSSVAMQRTAKAGLVSALTAGESICEHSVLIKSGGSATTETGDWLPLIKSEVSLLYVRCARRFSEAKKFDQAEKFYERYLDEYPDTDFTSVVEGELKELPLLRAETALDKGELDKAESLFKQLVETFPDGRLGKIAEAGLAKVAFAKAKILGAGKIGEIQGVKISEGNKPPVIILANGSANPLKIIFSGPQIVRETIPGCMGDCQSSSGFGSAGDQCPADSPDARFVLEAGSYDVLVTSVRRDEVRPFTGTWQLDNDHGYNRCFYITCKPAER